MEYLYAPLLLHSAGQKINEENIKKDLSAAGIEAEETRVKALVAALSEIKMDEVLKSMQTIPVAAAPSPPVEIKKEKEKPAEKEKKEEKALEGLKALFGDSS